MMKMDETKESPQGTTFLWGYAIAVCPPRLCGARLKNEGVRAHVASPRRGVSPKGT